jgi:hypothetical protein
VTFALSVKGKTRWPLFILFVYYQMNSIVTTESNCLKNLQGAELRKILNPFLMTYHRHYNIYCVLNEPVSYLENVSTYLILLEISISLHPRDKD